MRLPLIFILIVLSACSSSSSLAPLGDGGAAIVSKGSRLLGMDTNDPSSDFTFNQSFSAAQSIGVSAGTFHLNWNTDEASGSSSTSGAFTDVGGALASANAYYPSVSAKL